MTINGGNNPIDKLEPALVWKLFAGIAAQPRASKNEERIRAHVRSLAEKNGLSPREDSVGNMVIDVPASPGCESAPSVVLQGHLDMVHEKNADTEFDFGNDPIRLVLEKQRDSGEMIVHAGGTTLGADNGIGVAMALAAACSPDVVHGPMELLFTVDEEAGMTGVGALVPEFFHSRVLLNLDSEEDNILYIGCAGGSDINLSFACAVETIPDGYEVCRIAVSGLRGGHSGGDIHEGRGNAIRILSRTLRRGGGDKLRICSFNAGSKRNAIPREGEVVVCGPSGTISELQAAAETVRGEASAESREPGLAIRVESTNDGSIKQALTAADTQRILEVISALPHGVIGMHPTVEGLVETSNNVATVRSSSSPQDAQMLMEIGNLVRSSSASRIREALDQIASVGRLSGAEVVEANGYPGWEPNLDSPVLDVCRRIYKQLFGEAPRVAAIHAGLECGLIQERIGKMDMVSFGPRIEGAHSPDERVYVASVQKSWKYFCAVLKELVQG